MSEEEQIDFLELMGDEKAWSAKKLSEESGLPVEKVRRLMIRLENCGDVRHVKEGRYNWYFTNFGYIKYLRNNLKEMIHRIMKNIGV